MTHSLPLPCFVRLLDSRLRDTKLLLNYRSPQCSNAHWELVKQLDPRFTYRRLLKSNLGTLLSRTQFARRSTVSLYRTGSLVLQTATYLLRSPNALTRPASVVNYIRR